MSSEEQSTPMSVDVAPEPPTKRGIGMRTALLGALVVVLVLDAIAFVAFPPFPPGEPGAPCPFPVCFIQGTLELPAPTVLVNFADQPAPPASGLQIIFEPSITNTIFTLFLVTAGLLVFIALAGRGGAGKPGPLQNFAEWAYEMMDNFATGIGGLASRPYVQIFVTFFSLILISSWIGLIPPVGRIEYFRAPTSDVNVTIGLALVSFVMFEVEGFRRLGGRRYLSKFFPIYEFKKGIAAGSIAMFVGITEFMLDLVRPLTLSMRLFGNIYGGEVALGVITALTVAFLPVLLLGLEFMLNLIQALIFSILTFMYIVLAIEPHEHEEGGLAEEALGSVAGHEPAHAEPQPRHQVPVPEARASLGQAQSI